MERDASEVNLVKEAASGNTGAFSELVRRYRARVLRTAYGLVNSVEEAEDMAQEVFVKVWNHLPQYDPRGGFASWLYRITVNTCIDALRKRPGEVALDGLERGEREGPEEALLRRDMSSRVRTAVAALPPGARVALILREYEELSYKEIAEVLRIPIGTVMSRLHYARQVLKKALDPMEGV